LNSRNAHESGLSWLAEQASIGRLQACFQRAKRFIALLCDQDLTDIMYSFASSSCTPQRLRDRRQRLRQKSQHDRSRKCSDQNMRATPHRRTASAQPTARLPDRRLPDCLIA
jgi:hypothetical protein